MSVLLLFHIRYVHIAVWQSGGVVCSCVTCYVVFMARFILTKVEGFFFFFFGDNYILLP